MTDYSVLVTALIEHFDSSRQKFQGFKPKKKLPELGQKIHDSKTFTEVGDHIASAWGSGFGLQDTAEGAKTYTLQIEADSKTFDAAMKYLGYDATTSPEGTQYVMDGSPFPVSMTAEGKSLTVVVHNQLAPGAESVV